MTPANRQVLKRILTDAEGYRQFPYTDTTGHLTIGCGRNIQLRGISLDEALFLLDDDIQWFANELVDKCPVYSTLDDNRQLACVEMAFNLGLQGFLQFHDMLAALADKDWQKAHDACLESLAAKQLHSRYVRIAQVLLTGVL
jgi:lysozyme